VGLTKMVDAVAYAGADPTGTSDSTMALSNAVAMCFETGSGSPYPTMQALDSDKPPASVVSRIWLDNPMLSHEFPRGLSSNDIGPPGTWKRAIRLSTHFLDTTLVLLR